MFHRRKIEVKANARNSCICGLLCLLAASCNNIGNTNAESAATTVTVIFQDAPAQSMTKRFGGTLQALPEGTFIYVDSMQQRVYYTPRSIGQDTLIISAPFGYAEVIHRNQAIENSYYLLKAGDTVLFTYGENLRPQIRSLCFRFLSCGSTIFFYNLPLFISKVG